MNYKTLFVKLKLEDIRKLVDAARKYSNEKIVRVELERTLTEIDLTMKALEGKE